MAYKKTYGSNRSSRSTRSASRVRSKTYSKRTGVRGSGRKSTARAYNSNQTIRLVIEQPQSQNTSVNPFTFAPQANDNTSAKKAKF